MTSISIKINKCCYVYCKYCEFNFKILGRKIIFVANKKIKIKITAILSEISNSNLARAVIELRKPLDPNRRLVDTPMKDRAPKHCVAQWMKQLIKTGEKAA